ESFGCKNFLGYEEASVSLPKGLTLIEGFNHDFATTSSNGAGKSGLIEPIPFALFGKTIRGMEVKHGKDSVVRDASTGGGYAWVELYVENDRKLRVERYRKHKKHGNSIRVWLDGKDIVKGRSIPDTDKNIVDLIGVEFDLFIRTVVIHSRITESFSSLNDRHLRNLSESLLALPDFEALQKTATNKFNDMESKVEKSVAEVKAIASQIDDCVDHLFDLRKQETEFEEEQKNRKGVLREEDIQRAKSLLPGWKAAHFAPGFISREIAVLRAIIDNGQNTLLQEGFKKFGIDRNIKDEEFGFSENK
ncbi:hypothetical protein LCGC14_2275570, partial [marine sediment metagenome]